MNIPPRVSIAHLPTPVESLERLSQKLKGPRILVKRDDQTGLAFGGNKARKLEFLVAEALSMGAKTLITAGALQSNHCRQTAAAATRYGLKCILVLSGEPEQKPSANYLIDLLFNAEIVWTVWHERFEALQRVFNDAQKAGKQPYLVPYGGSNPTGATGYVFAIQELMEQEIHPDWIIFPSSSGGTQAGLVAGARIWDFPGKILGISVDEPEKKLRRKVADLASEVMEKLGKPLTITPNEVLVNADFCEAGYGVLTPGEIEAIHLFAKEEGLLLDPVYTGRAASGLVNMVRNGYFMQNESILFWHTGGTPALFANQYREIVRHM